MTRQTLSDEPMQRDRSAWHAVLILVLCLVGLIAWQLLET